MEINEELSLCSVKEKMKQVSSNIAVDMYTFNRMCLKKQH